VSKCMQLVASCIRIGLITVREIPLKLCIQDTEHCQVHAECNRDAGTFCVYENKTSAIIMAYFGGISHSFEKLLM